MYSKGAALRQSVLEAMALAPYMLLRRKATDGTILGVALTLNGALFARLLIEADEQDPNGTAR